MMIVEPKRREIDVVVDIVKDGEIAMELPKDIEIDAEFPKRVFVKKIIDLCSSIPQITFQISITEEAELGITVYPDIVWLTEDNGYSDYFEVLSNTNWQVYKEE